MRWSARIVGERIVGGDIGEQRHGERLVCPVAALSNSAVTIQASAILSGASQVREAREHRGELGAPAAT